MECLLDIAKQTYLSLDTETTGLYPFHGDKFFSIIIGTKDEEYYFNYNEYPGLPNDLLLPDRRILKDIFLDPTKYWFIHKANYDAPILRNDKLHIRGKKHCTKTIERVRYNEYNDYSLEACGERIKVPKDMTVAKYIKDKSLYCYRYINGKRIKQARYDLVPFEMMSKYGMQDARTTYDLGVYQIKKIEDRAQIQASKQNEGKTIVSCMENEVKLQRTLYFMQCYGAKIDTEFCERAVTHLGDSMLKSQEAFKTHTGRDFILSGKVFEEIFADQKELWSYTAKGNPSFDAKALKKLKGPVVETILSYKKAKAEIDFFKNFLFYADDLGILHTDLNAGGTRTGRFSSSNPNLQNLKKDQGESLEEEFVVRRAIIPRDGYFLAMLDYDQLEYRMMLDYAGSRSLIEKVLGGLDVHTATATNANCTRDEAKTVNFLTLYGGGIKKLADSLGTSESKAKSIQTRIFNAAPEVLHFIRSVIKACENRGFLSNFSGRINYFPKKNLCFKGPNTLIQGGAGDVVKIAMNNIQQYLEENGLLSMMTLNIHDELVFEIKYEEADILEDLKEIMEKAYPHRYLPLTVGIDYSEKSLADKQPWRGIEFLHGEKRRDTVQGKDISTVEKPAKFMGGENTTSGKAGNA